MLFLETRSERWVAGIGYLPEYPAYCSSGFISSWDAARSYFPKAANELCQVAKLTRAANPVRSVYPLDNRLLLGTRLIQRDYIQINLLESTLERTNFNQRDRQELEEIIHDMRVAIALHADPAIVDPATEDRFRDIATRIDQLTSNLTSADYPGPVD